MSNTKVPEIENLPKTGRVNEVCQEWMVREDSALAYRLQNQEFVDHLSGNKVRNALVREDYPKAKDEQVREQLLAEQAAAIYQKMLAEQEEIDKRVAKELAEKIDREEKMKRRMAEVRDQDIARQMLEKERSKVERLHSMPPQYYMSQKPVILPPKNEVQIPPHRPIAYNTPRRQAAVMPLPNEHPEVYIEPIGKQGEEVDSAELYNEPYKTSKQLSEHFNRIEIAEVGLDELTEKQIQERKDAELARQLQEQEGNLEDTLLNRDRMLAIEAQDKELAKLLQERERSKAKRAREKAKQKALARKQERSMNQILPDDSYALPADILLQHNSHVPRNIASYPDMYAVPNADEEDISYSLPADVLPSTSTKNNLKVHSSPSKFDPNGDVKEFNVGSGSGHSSMERGASASTPPIRPTHLDLRSPLNRSNKPRFPDPEPGDTSTMSSGHSGTSPSQLTNIAMAIDPTYNRRNFRPSSSYDTTSSTVTTSTSSSSPGMLMLPADIGEQNEDNPAPPYMPIQGQRRTASLEKKKKKGKDGCKQQ